MSSGHTIKTGSFLLQWVAAHLLAWVIGGVTGLILGVFTVMFSVLILFVLGFDLSDSAGVLAAAGTGLGFGATLGYLQHLLIRHRFRLELSYWVPASAAGGAIGGALAGLLLALARLPGGYLLLMDLPAASLASRLLEALPVVVLAGAIGCAQWLLLRRACDHAWLRVLGSVVGGLVFSSFFTGAPGRAVTSWLLGTCAQGAISGLVLLWLSRQPARPSSQRRRASVWDHAI